VAMPDGSPADRCRSILAGIPADGLFATGQGGNVPCRIGPEPFRLPPGLLKTIEGQGVLWLKFVKASHQLYLMSLRGEAPPWISGWLDLGKPPRLLEFARMNRFKRSVPPVLRPDVLLTDEGPVACELDSVPGGIGLLGCLSRLYEREGLACAGGPDGMVAGFRRAMSHAAGSAAPGATAIVVSNESRMYRPEMRWLAQALRDAGDPAWAVDPEAVRAVRTDRASGNGLAIATPQGDRLVALVYRFFELFDVPNVPHADEILDAARLKHVRLTPPPKPHLEEKLLFALLHHRALEPVWEKLLGEREHGELKALVIPTWVLDASPVPPHATVAGLELAGRPVQSWEALEHLSQKARALVLKPSGFGEDAWGSHGVRFGADLPAAEWAATVRRALADFPRHPWILQPHRRPSVIPVAYWDAAAGEVRELEGRVRLCPYYFVTGEDEAPLGGVLATVCPKEKKAIHGMPEAVMLPCSAVA